MKFRPLFLISFFFLSFSACDFPKHREPDAGTPPAKSNGESAPATVPWKGDAVAANTFIRIAKAADLAVVNIGTTKIFKRRNPYGFFGPGGRQPFPEFFGDDFFRRFFEEPGELPDLKQQSLGSGFVLTEDGYIVTNNHVVEKADEIKVTIGRDQEFVAKLVGADPKTDLALLKITPKEKLTTLSLGDSDELQVGEIVVAIGNPFGFSHTVTQGIVSAKERSIGFGPYDNFIQTDASINPGNSGGPLLNLKTEVVGINAAIMASGQGIGFAIPINLAKNVISQLKDKGTVVRGWLGVMIGPVDDDLAKALGLKDRRGALVSDVQPGSPAADAGMKRGDVVVRLGNKDVVDFNDLPRLVAGTPIGTKVEVGLVRDGKPMKVQVKIGELKASVEEGKESGEEEWGTDEDEAPSKVDLLGLSVMTLNERHIQDLSLPKGTQGVVVDSVSPASPAGDKLRRGDVIIEVNRKKLRQLSDYVKATKSLKKGDTVLLLVKKAGGGTAFVAITL